MMMRKKILSVVTAILIVFASALSCKKDKSECLTCKAVCSGTTTGDLNTCGDDLDAQEAKFKAENPGCTVTCTRN